MIKKIVDFIKENWNSILAVSLGFVVGVTVVIPLLIFFARLLWTMAFTPMVI